MNIAKWNKAHKEKPLTRFDRQNGIKYDVKMINKDCRMAWLLCAKKREGKQIEQKTETKNDIEKDFINELNGYSRTLKIWQLI